MGHGDYFLNRFSRTMVKSIILVIILVLLSLANKTILTAPLVHVGQPNATMIWLTLAQILGIYLGIQYIEACIDVLYFYVFRGGWKSEFWKRASFSPRGIEWIGSRDELWELIRELPEEKMVIWVDSRIVKESLNDELDSS